jgi:hypothetical protein
VSSNFTGLHRSYSATGKCLWIQCDSTMRVNLDPLRRIHYADIVLEAFVETDLVKIIRHMGGAVRGDLFGRLAPTLLSSASSAREVNHPHSSLRTSYF